MSINQFIEQYNVNMLWEIISDEENFKYLSRDIQAKIYKLFINNIQGFFNNERLNTNSLVDMNKKYILLIINHIKDKYNIQPNKIKIYQEPLKESITYEEIQNDKRSQFDRDYNKRQEEFEELVNVKVPPVPKFADKDVDKPIKEMDKILKDIQSQRNYEIEQINRNYNYNTTNADNWLKSQETSLKTDKYVTDIKNDESQNYSRFKYLNQDSFEDQKDVKNVSFSNIEDIINIVDTHDEEDINIFSKLKKISSKQTENIQLKIHEHEQTLFEKNVNKLNNEKNNRNEPMSDLNIEDRMSKLEMEIKTLNIRMDKVIELLTKIT